MVNIFRREYNHQILDYLIKLTTITYFKLNNFNHEKLYYYLRPFGAFNDW